MTVEANEPYDPKAGRITLSAEGHVALIGVDRPGKLNGFNTRMLHEIGEAYTEFDRNEAYRCAVLYGVGDNFTAGLELDEVAPFMMGRGSLAPDGAVDPYNLRPPLRRKPVVCAVQGYCYTIGIELMLAADIVVAAEGTRFSQLEVGRGIMANCGATMRMVERAGWGNGMLHLLTGDEFGTEEALRCGFVQMVVPTGEQLDKAKEIAATIAEQAPLAVQATLSNARTSARDGLPAAVAELAGINARLRDTEDAAEGVASFKERRKAVYKGR